MKVYRILMILALGLVLLNAGCAGNTGTHAKYRGRENAPHMVVQPVQVDMNYAMTLSPQEFDEYMRRIDAINGTVRDIEYNNGYGAYTEKQWENDVEGGPPAPPYVKGQPAPKASKSSSRTKRKKPTLQEQMADDAKKETRRLTRDIVRTTGSELKKNMRGILKDIF